VKVNFELLKGKKVLGEIQVPLTFRDIGFDTYIVGIFQLDHINQYLRKGLDSELAIDEFCRRKKISLSEAMSKKFHRRRISFQDEKGEKKSMTIGDAVKDIYREDVHIQLVQGFISEFYEVDMELVKLIPMGVLMKELREDWNEEIGVDESGEMIVMTASELYKRAINMITMYEPRLRSKGQDCKYRHRKQKCKIPVIYVKKVMEKKVLPFITTQQVVESLKIQYRYTKLIDGIPEDEKYEGVDGWKARAHFSFMKCITKISLFSIIRGWDEMPADDKSFDIWLDERVEFFSGYRGDDKIAPCINMCDGLDILFFLNGFGKPSKKIPRTNGFLLRRKRRTTRGTKSRSRRGRR